MSKVTDVIGFNEWTEHRFVRILRQMIDQGGGQVVRSKVVQKCARELGVTEGTVRRYINKYCASCAPFRLGPDDKTLGLNPSWKRKKRWPGDVLPELLADG